jgi:hypothetical protein
MGKGSGPMGTRHIAPAARNRLTAAVALVALATVAFGATACQPSRTTDRSHVVVMLHGWEALGRGTDCNSTFGSLSSSLRNRGFTGAMVTVGFYDTDKNCNVNLRDWGSIANTSSWEDLSKALSTYLFRTYTSKGITVDLVGHSMGGLIIRGAVFGSSHHDAGFSAPLLVEDAITLAGPHDGAAWYTTACLWGQCSGLKPGSSEIKWVQQDGNPQGAQGTEWTVFGSTADQVVPADSALDMAVPAAQKVEYTNLGHSDYMGDSTCEARVAQALAEPNL